VLQNYLYSILIKSYKVGIKCKPLFRNYLYSTLIKGFKIGLKSIPHINVCILMFIIMTPQKVSKIPLLYHNNNEYQNYYTRKQLRSPQDRLEIKS